MKKHYLTIGVVITCAVVFFFVGRVTAGTAARGALNRGTFAAGARTGMTGGFVSGRVVSVDGGVIVVSLPNGNSQNVYYSTSTSIVVPQTTSASALTPGTTVMIGGSQNADGSVTASTIQVRSATSTGGFGGR